LRSNGTVKEHDLRLFGHRGSSAKLPENTMAAFRRALDDGASALEMDLHRTADGHFVVAHDPDGLRMAGRPERIGESTLEGIRGWNVAAGFRGESGRVHRMPTLAAVLDELPEVPISVDVKAREPGSIPDLIELITRRGAAHRVTVGSFHDRLVYLTRRLGYTGPTALTRAEVAVTRLAPQSVCRRLVHGQAAMIPRDGMGLRLDGSRFIARCRRIGLRVDYWVVNDPADARRLLAAGATGIVSDDPVEIIPVMEEFER